MMMWLEKPASNHYPGEQLGCGRTVLLVALVVFGAVGSIVADEGFVDAQLASSGADVTSIIKTVVAAATGELRTVRQIDTLILARLFRLFPVFHAGGLYFLVDDGVHFRPD
jgi:hypothetical protein